MNNPHTPLIECFDLCKLFQDGTQTRPILNLVNFSLYAGERVAIVGASGSGKSTFLQILGGLDQPSSGVVQVGGYKLDQLNNRQLDKLHNQFIGFVYQFHHLLPEFTLLENICMPLFIQGIGTSEAKARAWPILEDMSLSERAYHKPNELSGGERQRGAIARARITNPPCLFADEPTGNLDNTTAQQVVRHLMELKHTSLIIVTHDIGIARKMDKIFSLKNGSLTDITHEK